MSNQNSCSKCEKKGIILLQHGALCQNHFLSYFEEKVFKTINKYNLLNRDDKICIAASGGKDSLTVLYLTKKYLEEKKISKENLFALVIDEGINNYREHTLSDLKEFCNNYDIPLKVVTNKEEFGYTLDEAYPIINKETKKKPCNICGVWRRYLLNKYARQFGATKIITGHNLDDEAQAVLMNIFKANTKLSAGLGPISGTKEQDLFVQRVKPLYFCTEKETRLYTVLKGFKVDFTECPYAADGFRANIRDMLNDFENKYKGTKQSIINSFLAMLPLLKEQARGESYAPPTRCTICTEPANKDVCNACVLKEELKNA
ncbi:MAG: TIGR00269 family protein [archaeon]|nr:TIGR00269 family protein [archaeon]